MSGDQIAFNFGMYKGKTGIGIGAMAMNAASQWTQFNVPITYFAAGVPDTCILQFQIFGSSGAPHAGSSYLLDNLAFSGVNAVNESALPNRFALEQNYPNPFNPSTTIAYQLAKESDVRLSVYDGLGGKWRPSRRRACPRGATEPNSRQLVWRAGWTRAASPQHPWTVHRLLCSSGR